MCQEAESMLIESHTKSSHTRTAGVAAAAMAGELAEFFDSARDLLCIADLAGYFKMANASFERVLGFSREDLMSRPFLDFVHPDDLQAAIDGLSMLTTGAGVVEFDCRLVCADGSARRFEWNARATPQVYLVHGVARDVRERTGLAEQQAALRRVLTLAARESSPAAFFAAVVEEVGRTVGVNSTAMLRYEEDGTAVAIASHGERPVPIRARFPLDGDSIHSRVFMTERPARIDDHANATGVIGRTFKELGVRSAAGAPIMVHGRLWGAMIAVAGEPLAEDTEVRVGEFTELVATAIANVDTRTELAASRARIVAAADEERRRVARDLHDGAQQRLVHTVITLKLAERALERDTPSGVSLVHEALEHAQCATDELRELAHGILPAPLTTSGLGAAVDALASRMQLPVSVDVQADRLPAPVEATAYFVVAEALTNIAKHARAASAAVVARVARRTLHIEVHDDGVGGASLEGSGLQGLRDRLAALGGWLRIESPDDGGTLVGAAIPIASDDTVDDSVWTIGVQARDRTRRVGVRLAP
jgi:PAS domain S-box-containing protein